MENNQPSICLIIGPWQPFAAGVLTRHDFVCSAQLRCHEIRLITSTRGTPTRLSRLAEPRSGWSATAKRPQFGVRRPVRYLSGFRTFAFGSCFRCKPSHHEVWCAASFDLDGNLFSINFRSNVRDGLRLVHGVYTP